MDDYANFSRSQTALAYFTQTRSCYAGERAERTRTAVRVRCWYALRSETVSDTHTGARCTGGIHSTTAPQFRYAHAANTPPDAPDARDSPAPPPPPLPPPPPPPPRPRLRHPPADCGAHQWSSISRRTRSSSAEAQRAVRSAAQACAYVGNIRPVCGRPARRHNTSTDWPRLVEAGRGWRRGWRPPRACSGAQAGVLAGALAGSPRTTGCLPRGRAPAAGPRARVRARGGAATARATRPKRHSAPARARGWGWGWGWG
jgi:hypothetical protein